MQVTIQIKLDKEHVQYFEKCAEYIAKLRAELLRALLRGEKLNELKKTFISEKVDEKSRSKKWCRNNRNKPSVQ